MTAPDPATLVERIEEAALASPAVARLDGGRFGAVASYLPGRKVVGVRTASAQEPTEVSVVLYLGIPVQEAVADLRSRVRGVVGNVPVDVTVSDVVVPGDETPE